jgi:hypothetical protein
MVAAVFFGVVCGLLGSFLIYVQTKMINFRKMKIKTNSRNILEGIFFAFVTAAGFYSAVLITSETCIKASPSHFHGRVNELFRFYCHEGYVNPLAALFFNTESGTVAEFLKKSPSCSRAILTNHQLSVQPNRL